MTPKSVKIYTTFDGLKNVIPRKQKQKKYDRHKILT